MLIQLITVIIVSRSFDLINRKHVCDKPYARTKDKYRKGRISQFCGTVHCETLQLTYRLLNATCAEDELVHGAVRCGFLSARASVALDVNDTTVSPTR